MNSVLFIYVALFNTISNTVLILVNLLIVLKFDILLILEQNCRRLVLDLIDHEHTWKLLNKNEAYL